MKNFNVTKLSICIIFVITIVFIAQLVGNMRGYSSAKDHLREGDYENAALMFEKLDGYRDSEILKKYCSIMGSYDEGDFSSIYRCHKELAKIEDQLNNRDLKEPIAKTTTEVATLYERYDMIITSDVVSSLQQENSMYTNTAFN